MTIGQRAFLVIHDMASQKGITFQKECENLNIDRSMPGYWKRGSCNPRSYALQQMALMGYDVIYILTGEKNEI